MLHEVDELDQFRITVQQLEICRDLILDGGETKWRAALILLDHASEVILYRIVQGELEHDDFTRKVVPERYPPKRRSKINRLFQAKLDVVANTHRLPTSVTTTLKILHSYRNAAYHRDRHNPAVLPILARVALVATADLFSRTGAGFKNMGIGGFDEPVDWLQRYGLENSPIWFESVAKAIARQLKAGVRPRLAIVIDGFAADIESRIAGVSEVLNELFSDGRTEDVDATLKRYEFRRVRPELESTLSQRFRTLTYKIASGHGEEVTRDEYDAAETEFRTAYDREFENFQASCRYKDLDSMKDQLPLLKSEKNFRSALARYAKLDEKLLSFEESVSRAHHEMEWWAEMQSDIARGK